MQFQYTDYALIDYTEHIFCFKVQLLIHKELLTIERSQFCLTCKNLFGVNSSKPSILYAESGTASLNSDCRWIDRLACVAYSS